MDQTTGSGGRFGEGYKWQGTDGVQDHASDGPWIEVPNHADINPGTAAFTIEWWIKFSGESGFQGPWHKGYVDSGEWTVHTYSGNLVLRYYGPAGQVQMSSAGTDHAEDTWYHMVIQRDGSGAGSVYINGARTQTFTDTSDWSNTSSMGFGRGGDTPALNVETVSNKPLRAHEQLR